MTGSVWNMKRRTVDSGKLRRPVGIKKAKLADGVYSSTILYMKFLVVWALVMVSDFIVEFRFEYLWPLWLLFRSAFDSFRYQGMLFCMLFCCVSIASDVVCYLFMPVQWLYMVASTYVWVQYVWHTDKGICLPTVSLWVLFVYIETSLRLRDFKCLPFHLDLCRPFAAHCIGYPVVTLGFGCKSYVSYKLRLRKQKEVQKENEFCFQLLQQALPPEQDVIFSSDTNGKLPTNRGEETNFLQFSNSTFTPLNEYNKKSLFSSDPLQNMMTGSSACSSSSSLQSLNGSVSSTGGGSHHKDVKNDYNSYSVSHQIIGHSLANNSALMDGGDYMDVGLTGAKIASSPSVNDFKEDGMAGELNAKIQKMPARNSIQLATTMKDNMTSASSLSNAGGNSSKKYKQNNISCQNSKDDPIQRLEQDVKRAKADLQNSKNIEQELRCQINSLLASDKSTKLEIIQLQQDNESLQTKLHNLVTSRQQDKQTLTTLERKLQEERKVKIGIEQQLQAEKKRKTDDTKVSVQAVKSECTDSCKNRRLEMENELKQVDWELKRREEQILRLEHEVQILRQYKDAQNDTEVLMSALMAMQEKNSHLETNLSAETRLKMDLFSALGDAKRQIEIQHSLLLQKDTEIRELQTKVAEVMALVPSTSGFGAICSGSQPHFSAAFTTPNYMGSDVVLSKSNLNPNASDYQPKASM